MIRKKHSVLSTFLSEFISEYLPALMMASVSLIILTHPELSSKAVNDALELCMGKVIPSLFPFMIISSMLISTGLLFKASKAPSLFLSHISGISPPAFQAFILGSFCGFPIGASCLFELYKKGDIGKEETERLLPSCNMCSPAFVIFFSAKAFANIPHAGTMLYLIQLLSSVSLLIFTALKAKRHHTIKTLENKPSLSFSEAVIGAVKNAVRSSCTVCGFVIMFYFFNELISFAFGECDMFKIPLLLISGILEVTCGMSKIADCGILSFCTASFFICFGGLSTVFQTFAIAPRELSKKRYIIGKAIMGIFGALIAVPVFLILGIS